MYAPALPFLCLPWGKNPSLWRKEGILRVGITLTRYAAPPLRVG